jgi:uncharacterized membrane protein
MKHSGTKKVAKGLKGIDSLKINQKYSSKKPFYDRKKLLLELIPLVLVLVTFIIAWYAYPMLPPKIPIHWNAAGQPNGYSDRSGVFLTPIIFLAVMILFFILPLMEVFRNNMLEMYNYYYAFKIIFSAFFLVLFIATLLPNFGYNINVASIIVSMIGVLFIGLGIILPKIKRNFMFGIRTGWTLSSDYVWEKTHKLGGILFTIAGIIILILLFFLKLEMLFFVFITLIIGVSLFIVFYSYYIYSQENKKNNNSRKI